MLDFGALPPEVNSGRMYVGAGSGPMLAAAAAWDSLAADLQAASASYGSTIQTLTVGPWTGPSSMAMAAAATPYVAWINATGAQAELAASQAKVAAGAYETAFAAMVPPPVIAANRALLAALIATNIFGPKHPGDSGRRNPLRGNVGTGCGRDVCLRRLVVNRVAADVVCRAATDDERARRSFNRRPPPPARVSLAPSTSWSR